MAFLDKVSYLGENAVKKTNEAAEVAKKSVYDRFSEYRTQ
jgi:hypothetical protein